MRINVGGAMHAKNIQSPLFNDGQIHIAKWVRNAFDLNKSGGFVGISSLPPLTKNVLNEIDPPQK